MHKNFDKGFTLAEVLIALGVIGVVSAMTLPVLIKIYNKNVIENQLKKSYTTMMQAIKMSEVYNDEVKYWTFPTENTIEKNQEFLNKYLSPYMKIINNCGIERGCWSDVEYSMSGAKNTLISDPESSYKVNKFVIAGGINIAFYTSTDGLMRFYLDVNGHKGPNTRGKDIFEFILLRDDDTALYFHSNGYNMSNSLLKANCKKSGSGDSCAEILIRNGFKFPKDYPW